MYFKIPSLYKSTQKAFVAKWLGLGIGFLLLSASFLKAKALFTDPRPEITFLDSPKIQLLTIEMELLLGVWLFSGWNRRIAWLTAMCFFGILAFTSFFMVWIELPTCSCLGAYSVPPKWIFGFDLIILYLLATFKPNKIESLGQKSNILSVVSVGVCFFILFHGILSIPAAWAIQSKTDLREEYLEINPPWVDLGEAPWRTARTFTVQINNKSTEPINIIGGMNDCAISTLKNLPITIPPGQSKHIEIEASFRGQPGTSRRQYHLYTDFGKQKIVVAGYSWKISAPLDSTDNSKGETFKSEALIPGTLP